MNTEHEVTTRPEAGAQAIKTALTINWDGMTEDEVRALAAQSLVIKLQGNWRRDKAIPETAEVKAVDYKIGTRAPRKAPDLATMIANLSAEEKAALLAQLAA